MRFIKFYDNIINLEHLQHVKICESEYGRYELNILYRNNNKTLCVFDTQEDAIINLNNLFDIINKYEISESKQKTS